MIYIVDDEFMIREVLSSFVRHLGYDSQTFESGDHFLAYMDKEGFQAPDILFSDIRMPGISGLEMVQQFKHHHPDVPCCIITGYDDTIAHDHPIYKTVHAVIGKPFKLKDIQHVLEICQQEDYQATFAEISYSSASM